jgi:hypothetical protein
MIFPPCRRKCADGSPLFERCGITQWGLKASDTYILRQIAHRSKVQRDGRTMLGGVGARQRIRARVGLVL